MRNEKNTAGMAKFGINPRNTLGISMPGLRKIAKNTGKNHALALRLWASGIHEARVMAALVDEPEKVTENQMDKWVKDFDSWDVCDVTCDYVFAPSEHAFAKCVEWSGRKEEYVRRAAFTTMAMIAWFRIDFTRGKAEKMLSLIKKYSADERNFVRKAVNWALRNIGKSGTKYYKDALGTARKLAKSGSKSARWIAKDAIRELLKPSIIARAKEREKRFETLNDTAEKS
jgi:3-methyladenine DNA glycosylase AlkD